MKAFIFLFLFSLPTHALIFLEGFGQFGFGDLKENPETITSSQSLTHDGWLMGVGMGARAGLSVSLIKVGVVGDYAKIQWEGEREDGNIQNSFDGAEDYDNVFERTMVGGFAKVQIPALPVYILGEYYSKVKAQATYAEGRGENPFAQGDKMYGKGFGLGVGGQAVFISYSALLRSITYDKFVLSGVENKLPNSRFQEKQGSWEVMFQIGMAIDLL